MSRQEHAARWIESAKRFPHTPPLSDEAVSRESMYADRGEMSVIIDSNVLTELAAIEELPTLLPDSPAIFPELKRLVTRYRSLGVKVHDARLAALHPAEI
jgi:hypothetical protein